MDKPIIYTIGHSTHSLEYFLELLREYGIDCIVDIRSVPASAYNPQFNQEPFKNFLKRNKITYLPFAEEFGARQTDPDLLDNSGKLDFEKVRKTWSFKNGLERIWIGVEKYKIAIMCSEGEPLDCHRFSMVSLGLVNDGFEVKHILKDKSLKSNSELEKDLLKQFEKKIPQINIFEPDITIDDQLKAAYRLKNKEIGYSPYSNNQKEESYD
ncbi:MAG: DUF488 domain-containing protein [Bacteroidetes bacterium]|nr:DUF488 domain-containing protein [Bacteroidota bacterium]